MTQAFDKKTGREVLVRDRVRDRAGYEWYVSGIPPKGHYAHGKVSVVKMPDAPALLGQSFDPDVFGLELRDE